MTRTDNTGRTAGERDKVNQRRVLVWSLVWVASFLAVDYAIAEDMIGGGAVIVGATAAISVLGIGVLASFHRFLRGTDELMRKIQLDALALTVGIGFVSAFGYSLLQDTAIVASSDATTILVVAMATTCVVGVVLGRRRYA
ncbi:hypothetical protein BH23ACT10_BH23ACT10_08300 [soil metagenome]